MTANELGERGEEWEEEEKPSTFPMIKKIIKEQRLLLNVFVAGFKKSDMATVC